MAIINNAHPGSQINLLCMIYRVIMRNSGKLTVEEIQSLCSPESLATLPDHVKRFPTNLQFWMHESHQLWREDEQHKLILTRDAASEAPADIAIVTNEALFAPKMKTIFGSDEHDTEGLFRALGCLLASDRFALESPLRMNKPTLQDFYSQQLRDFVPNDSERVIVNRYGHFLGFLEGTASGEYLVDPTRAVRGVLGQVFSDRGELEARQFLERLSGLLPLLDGGSYRVEVEKRMAGPISGDITSRRLSKSLSLALERLTYAGILAHERKSDDPNMCFIQVHGSDQGASSFRYLSAGPRL
jgi:hypothetical protein